MLRKAALPRGEGGVPRGEAPPISGTLFFLLCVCVSFVVPFVCVFLLEGFPGFTCPCMVGNQGDNPFSERNLAGYPIIVTGIRWVSPKIPFTKSGCQHRNLGF